MKQVGFWKNPARSHGGLVEVQSTKGTLSNEECDAVIAYISASTVETAWKGIAYCRGCTEYKMLGSCDMVTPDREFIFPQGYEHYIVEHQVRPPEDFIRAAIKSTEECDGQR